MWQFRMRTRPSPSNRRLTLAGIAGSLQAYAQLSIEVDQHTLASQPWTGVVVTSNIQESLPVEARVSMELRGGIVIVERTGFAG